MADVFINYLTEFVREHLLVHVVLIGLSLSMMIISMAVDLWSGVLKAKKNGQARTSTGFKKTCEKGRKYFSPFLVLVCIDFITCVIIPFPVFSMIWAMYCIFCEFKSVRENHWKKAEMRKQERTFSIALENVDDVKKMVAEAVKEIMRDQPTKGGENG